MLAFSNGRTKSDDIGIEKVATKRIASKRFDARENIADPKRHTIVQNTKTAVEYRY